MKNEMGSELFTVKPEMGSIMEKVERESIRKKDMEKEMGGLEFFNFIPPSEPILERSALFSDHHPDATFLHDIEYLCHTTPSRPVEFVDKSIKNESILIKKVSDIVPKKGSYAVIPYEGFKMGVNEKSKEEIFGKVKTGEKLNYSSHFNKNDSKRQAYYLLFRYSTVFSALPRDIIQEIVGVLNHFLSPTIVFGIYFNLEEHFLK
jgi:hypothetical protein